MGVDCKGIVRMKSGDMKFIDLDRYSDWKDTYWDEYILQSPLTPEQAFIDVQKLWERDKSRHFVVKFMEILVHYKDQIESVFIQGEFGWLSLDEPFYTVKEELTIPKYQKSTENVEALKYELKDGKLIKDGHTMFLEDVVKDLNSINRALGVENDLVKMRSAEVATLTVELTKVKEERDELLLKVKPEKKSGYCNCGSEDGSMLLEGVECCDACHKEIDVFKEEE